MTVTIRGQAHKDANNIFQFHVYLLQFMYVLLVTCHTCCSESYSMEFIVENLLEYK